MASSPDGSGLEIGVVSEDEFRGFVWRHGTSPEIGRIGTYFDEHTPGHEVARLQLLGLSGCGKLCGVACCTLAGAAPDGAMGGKLDSVIVDGALRRRGLAGLLVARSFLDLLAAAGAQVATLYAHAVHPATVRLLRRLSFSEPLPTGAPLSALRIGAGDRDQVDARLQSQIRDATARLKLQCALCRAGDRRARPWCLPRRS